MVLSAGAAVASWDEAESAARRRRAREESEREESEGEGEGVRMLGRLVTAEQQAEEK